jgi:hypothetical protein
LALPLLLAFTPAAIVLLLLSIQPADKSLAAFCVPAAIVSIACCAISSVMLFRRKTTQAIVGGVLLCLLNVAITAGLGCAALLAGISVH